MLVNKNKLQQLQTDLDSSDTVAVTDYGPVVLSGYGKGPSADVRDLMDDFHEPIMDMIEEIGVKADEAATDTADVDVVDND